MTIYIAEQSRDHMKDFSTNTKHRITKFGHEIKCRKGLWSVCCPELGTALKEAAHYYQQYYFDGEYD